MALFGEKYQGDVRVVSMGDFSKELCGGTHVHNTADIKLFKILSENGIAAGVRRIEALTGDGVIEFYQDIESRMQKVAELLKTNESELVSKAESVLDEMKALKSENEKLKAKLASEALGDSKESIEEIGGVKFIAMQVSGVEMNELRNLGDKLKEDVDGGVVVLASDVDGKVNLLCMAGDKALSLGAHAGNVIKGIAAIVGGGGGGSQWPAPVFDITLLGMGPDGHIASLFPGRKQVLLGTGLPEDPVEGGKAVTVMVSDSPKPPAERVSVTLPIINNSRHVFFLITGEDKQDATSRLLAGAKLDAEDLNAELLLETPAVGARGKKQTLIFATEESLAPENRP